MKYILFHSNPYNYSECEVAVYWNKYVDRPWLLKIKGQITNLRRQGLVEEGQTRYPFPAEFCDLLPQPN